MIKIINIAFVFAVFGAGPIFPLGKVQGIRQNYNQEQSEESSLVANTTIVNSFNLLGPEVVLSTGSRAELVMNSLAAAHPKRVGEAVFRDGDWAVFLRGKWYYFADGRILPENLRTNADIYGNQPFYPYPSELPQWKRPSPTEAAQLILAVKQRSSKDRPKRAQFFFDDLWNVHDRAEAWKQVKTARFLGRELLIHHAILEEMALVEQRINELAETDAEVRDWIKTIDSLSGWNWRNIADVQSRSNHSYGIAVDIICKSQKKLETYWLWTAQKNIDWWDIPYTARLHPPTSVIKAFESYGFVWGGKWTFYDTMHFEYRPEILLLNNIPIEGEY